MARNVEAEALGGLTRWGRGALLVLLAYWTFQFAQTPLGSDALDSFLHLPNLVFHEAGHVLFSFMGRFMTALGGSLLQCLVPVIIAIAFTRQGERFGAAVAAWWSGQNLIDLAPYIADARSLRLPLLGGRTGAEVEGHDWEFILTQLGVTHLDRGIALTVYAIGLVVMLASLGYAASLAARNSE